MAFPHSDSFRITRSASAVLTGGVAAAPSHDVDSGQGPSVSSFERLLVRRQSSRRWQDSQAVQERLRSEAMANLGRRYFPFLLIGAIALFSVLLTSLFLSMRAAFACLVHSGQPCDQPMLKYYLLISWSTGMSSNKMSTHLSSWAQSRMTSTRTITILSMILTSFAGWVVLAWGLYMIRTSRTCKDTNPDLFYSTRDVIIMQVVTMIVYLLIVNPCVALAHRLFLAVAALETGEGTSGCPETVKRLPNMPSDSADLLDPEDGQMMECAICLESFATLSVVRTPCLHYFHEECLGKWCTTHVSCPLCKGLIGVPDSEP